MTSLLIPLGILVALGVIGFVFVWYTGSPAPEEVEQSPTVTIDLGGLSARFTAEATAYEKSHRGVKTWAAFHGEVRDLLPASSHPES